MIPIQVKYSATLGLCGLLAGCGGGGDVPVRAGPQAVHPSPSALAQNRAGGTAAPVATPTAIASSEARQVFDTYCTPGASNTARVTAVINSGQFGPQGLGALPVPGFEDVIFVYYKLRAGAAQVGFASRGPAEQYCIAVDGTRSGNEYYVAGP